MTPDQDISFVARRQHGLITRSQAVAAGLSDRQIAARVSTGQWRRVRRAVFAAATTPSTFEQAVLAAILGAAAPVWASNRTAARLYGLRVSTDGPIEIVGRRTNRLRLAGVRTHRSGQLPQPDLDRHHGIPVTSPARTLVDLSTDLSISQFGRLLDEAERGGLCTAASVARCAGRLDAAVGRSLAVVRVAIELRLPGYGPGDSELEQDALCALAAAGLPLPQRHYRVTLDGHQYEVDLAYPEWRIAIEILGFRYHGPRSAFDADTERTRRFVLHGWTQLPFTSVTSGPALASDVHRLILRTPLAG